MGKVYEYFLDARREGYILIFCSIYFFFDYFDFEIPQESDFDLFGVIGFFYLTYPRRADLSKDEAGTETDQNLNARLCYHTLGTPQSTDILICQDAANPLHMFSAEVSDDGKYLLVSVSESCDTKNKLWIADLESLGAGKGGSGLKDKKVTKVEFKKVVDEFKAEYS